MFSFDHAVVNVMGEMDVAVEQYARLGFTLGPRGYHTLGSINHLAVFQDSYLELLGYAPGEREKRAEMWLHPAGLTGLAMRVADAAGLHAVLEAKGVPVEPYKDFSRPVDIDGESREASFRTFQIDRSKVENGRIFFCQHNTPELIWRPEWQDHPNGATGIASATIIATEPDRLGTLLDFARAQDGTLRMGDTLLEIKTPDEAASTFAADGPVPDLAGKDMRMVALDLICLSLDRAASVLEQNGVPFHRAPDHIAVSPEAAFGVILRFVEAAADA